MFNNAERACRPNEWSMSKYEESGLSRPRGHFIWVCTKILRFLLQILISVKEWVTIIFNALVLARERCYLLLVNPVAFLRYCLRTCFEVLEHSPHQLWMERGESSVVWSARLCGRGYLAASVEEASIQIDRSKRSSFAKSVLPWNMATSSKCGMFCNGVYSAMHCFCFSDFLLLHRVR